MPLFELIMISAGVVALGLAAGAWRSSVRVMLAHGKVWLLVALGSVLLTLASALVSTERHSGTGFLTSYGWPKPYCFAWRSWQDASRSGECNPLYLAGDLFFYGSVLLALAILCETAVAFFGPRAKTR